METMGRHVPDAPDTLKSDASRRYWDLFTSTYDFQDSEAPTLATLCNLHAMADKCQDMCFDRSGAPSPLLPAKMLSGNQEETGLVPNVFLDQLACVDRQIERLNASLGIRIYEKVPVKATVETPIDRAVRERESRAAND